MKTKQSYIRKFMYGDYRGRKLSGANLSAVILDVFRVITSKRVSVVLGDNFCQIGTSPGHKGKTFLEALFNAVADYCRIQVVLEDLAKKHGVFLYEVMLHDFKKYTRDHVVIKTEFAECFVPKYSPKYTTAELEILSSIIKEQENETRKTQKI